MTDRTFYVTFPQKYRRWWHVHPVFPGLHPDGYAVILADHDTPMAMLQAGCDAMFGGEWSEIRDADDFTPSAYPRGELCRMYAFLHRRPPMD